MRIRPQLVQLTDRDAPSSILIHDLQLISAPSVAKEQVRSGWPAVDLSIPTAKAFEPIFVAIRPEAVAPFSPAPNWQPVELYPQVRLNGSLPIDFAPASVAPVPSNRWTTETRTDHETPSIHSPAKSAPVAPAEQRLLPPKEESFLARFAILPQTKPAVPKWNDISGLANRLPRYDLSPTPVTPAAPTAPSVPISDSPPLPTPSLPPGVTVGGSVSQVPEAPAKASPTVQVLDSTTPTFRISEQAATTVSYTLTAHNSSGSTTQSGKATISNGPAVVVPANLTIAGRAPDIITLSLRDNPASSATYFASPVSQINDATLFEAHRIGHSAKAFDELVKRHEARVASIVERIVGNKTDAEDVRQFVFLELSRFQNSFTQGMTGWLNTVSRNAALTFLRTKRRRLHHEQAAARSIRVEPSTPLGLDETLAAAIQQLPTELGQAVRLRYVEGYTQEEAAHIVGVPRGTLSRRASSGLQVLREWLALDKSA